MATLAVTGSYLLARSYDVRPPLAAVASSAGLHVAGIVLAVLAGVTAVVALLALAVFLVRRR